MKENSPMWASPKALIIPSLVECLESMKIKNMIIAFKITIPAVIIRIVAILEATKFKFINIPMEIKNIELNK